MLVDDGKEPLIRAVNANGEQKFDPHAKLPLVMVHDVPKVELPVEEQKFVKPTEYDVIWLELLTVTLIESPLPWVPVYVPGAGVMPPTLMVPDFVHWTPSAVVVNDQFLLPPELYECCEFACVDDAPSPKSH